MSTKSLLGLLGLVTISSVVAICLPDTLNLIEGCVNIVQNAPKFLETELIPEYCGVRDTFSQYKATLGLIATPQLLFYSGYSALKWAKGVFDSMPARSIENPYSRNSSEHPMARKMGPER